MKWYRLWDHLRRHFENNFHEVFRTIIHDLRLKDLSVENIDQRPKFQSFDLKMKNSRVSFSIILIATYVFVFYLFSYTLKYNAHTYYSLFSLTHPRVVRWRDPAYRSHHDPLTPYSFDLCIAAVTAPAAWILPCSHVNSLHSIKEEEEGH